MASKYQKAFSLPTDFPDTLREFTREVLRDQPEDINKYAYEYFMAKLQAEGSSSGPVEASGAVDVAATTSQ